MLTPHPPVETRDEADSPLRACMRQFGVSVFTRTRAALANRTSAVNLAQGVPDFDPPPALVRAAATAMEQHVHQYTPSSGLPALRAAVAAHAADSYGLTYDPDTEVTVTVGATEGIWSATTALMEPGDEAIVIEPFYEMYPPCVAAAGGVVRYVPTTFPDFRLDLDRIAAAFSPRTRLIFLNTPGNPSGRLFDAAELALVGELAHRYDAYIISDETYEHLTYDGRAHLPVAAVPECRDRTVTVSSASKTFSVTGWRVGWVLAPARLTDAVRRVHQFVTFAAASPLQHAVATMLEIAGSGGYFAELAAEYAGRRSILLDHLDEAGLAAARPAGGYFVLAHCAGDDVAWCAELLDRAGVAAIPASGFYHHRGVGRGLVRFGFCKKLETLQEAGSRLARLHSGA
jgi:N-succinyldiaminopimelate aminotransferase